MILDTSQYNNLGGNSTMKEVSIATRRERQDRERDANFSRGLIYAPLGSVVGAVDTLGQSLGILEEDTIEENLRHVDNHIGTVGFSETYAANKTGYRLAGDVATTLTGYGALSKIAKAPAILKNTASGTVLGRQIAQKGLTASKLIVGDYSKTRRYMQQYARRAVTAGRQGQVRNYGSTEAGKRAIRRIRLSDAGNQLKQNLALEAFILTAQSESELYFPEGVTPGAVASSLALGVGAPSLMSQFTLNPALARAAGIGASEASKVSAAYSANHGFNITAGLFNRDFLDAKRASGAQAALLEDSGTAGVQIAAAENFADSAVRNGISGLLASDPIDGFTKSIIYDGSSAHGQRVKKTVEDFARNNPRTTTSLVSIDSADAIDGWVKFKAEKVDELRAKASKLEKEWKIEPDPSLKAKYRDDIENAKREADVLENETTLVRVNSLGISSTAIDEKSVFDIENVRTTTGVTTAGKNSKVSDTFTFTEVPKDKRPIGLSASGVPVMRREGKKGVQVARMNSQKVEDLSHFDRSKYLRAMPQALAKLREFVDGGEISVVKNKMTSQSSVEELTYGLAAAEEFGLANPQLAKAIDLSDFKSLDEMKVALLDAKYQRFLRLGKEIDDLTVQGIESEFDVGMRLLVPSATDYDRFSFAIEWFDALQGAGVKSIKGNIEDLRRDFTATAALELTPKTAEAIAIDNPTMFDKMFFDNYAAKNPSTREPVTLVSRPVGSLSGDTWHVNWQDQAEVARVMQEERVQELAQVAARNPFATFLNDLNAEFEGMGEIVEDIRLGVTKISADQGSKPAVERAGFLLPTSVDFRNRNVTTAGDASLLTDGIFRMTRKRADERVENGTTAMRELLKDENDSSWLRYGDLVGAMQRGWVLELDSLHALDGGKIKLAANNKQNAEIAKQMGLDEVPEYLPSTLADANNTRVVTPVRLDAKAHAAALEAMQLSETNYHVTNALRRANGRAPLEYRYGHMIAPSTYGQEIVYLQDKHGKVIDREYGRSVTHARQRLESRKADMKEKETLRIVDSTQVEDFHLANDRAWNDSSLDMTIGWNQTGGRTAEGGRAGVLLSKDYLRQQIGAIHPMYDNHTRLYLQTQFRNELVQLDAMSHMASLDQGGVLANAGTGKRARSYANAYQTYTAQLLNMPVDNPGSLPSMLNRGVEGILDGVMLKAYETLFGLRANKGFTREAKLTEGFKKLADDYGFEPGQAAIRAAQRETGGDNPILSKDLSQGLARATTAVALQLGEVGHALLTTASILTTAPHTAAYMIRKANETDAAYARRLGPMAKILADGKTPVPEPSKLVITTMQKFWRGEYDDVIKEANERGYMTAHVAEFMASLTGKADQSKVGGILSNAGHLLSAPTRWSEDFARKFSFLMGYELFNSVGQKGRRVSMAAANDFANKTIADYRPSQRSEMFRGAAGTQLGLFQTFGLNYLQRLAVSIENKAARAAFTQVGSQAFVFGVNGLPGWAQYNEAIASNWDHTARPSDNFAKMEDEGLGDLFLYGTVSNLPRLMGIQANSLYTRGEIQLPRVYTVADWKETPAATLGARAGSAIMEAGTSLRKYGSLGEANFIEGMALMSPNRPIKGLLELWPIGYATNKYGDVVSGPDEEFNTLSNVVYRLAGTKPLRESKRGEALYRDTQTQAKRREGKDKLNRVMASKLRRSGKFDADDMAKVLEDYIAYGGSPSHVRSWMKRLATKAVLSKYERELSTKLKSSGSMEDMVNFVTTADGANVAIEMGLLAK